MKSLYFIGIAGTAMGNLAIALAQRGFKVFGSDTGVYPPMSSMLENNGIGFATFFDAKHIKNYVPDLVIIGNAISRGNPEVEYVLNEKIPFISMSEMIHDEIIGNNDAIVITGTHGKTTTSSLTTTIFEHAGRKPGFVIGAKPGNFEYGCRPIPEQMFLSGTGICIIEGDEYDTAFWDKRSKFFHYPPQIAVINAIEYDHSDIFSSIDEILKTFRLFLRLIPVKGLVLLNADDPLALSMKDHAFSRIETFSTLGKGDWNATIVSQDKGGTMFSYHHNGILIDTVIIPMIGMHNVRNALASIACAHHSGISKNDINNGLKEFIPPKRRLENLGEWKKRIVIDDFAHHPTAIKETVHALRSIYPEKNIHAVFEPRSNTTTRNIFQKELASCFLGVNSIYLGPINRPERFAPTERLDVDALQYAYEQQGISVFAVKEDIPTWGTHIIDDLEQHTKPGDIIVLMSNGNIGTLRTLLLSV
ncbi:MAG: UDP-N-acetylmuramate--alanine ligase [Ignavibacteria bacterium]|nr:UDP-N-acetylmuramate--alanine ligase [Ignavibacteria bacterium]